MLVHIRELSCLPDYADWDYDNTKFIAAHEIKDYDKFVKFVQTLKKYGKDLIVNDEYYTVEDYAFVFPQNSDSVPCLYVYVSGY